MPNLTLARISKTLQAVLSEDVLERLARKSQFSFRTPRGIDASNFVHSLLTSLGIGNVETIADLHRGHNADHGSSVNYKPYYDRLNRAGFAQMMEQLFQEMLGAFRVILDAFIQSVLQGLSCT